MESVMLPVLEGLVWKLQVLLWHAHNKGEGATFQTVSSTGGLGCERLLWCWIATPKP